MSRTPSHGLYCPVNEDHPGRCDRLIAAINQDSIFLHCHEHDWVEIEFYLHGTRVKFNPENLAIIIRQVEPEPGKDKLHFHLKQVPVHAKGPFRVKNRSFRKGKK